MCEIAVLDPEETSIEIAQQLAATFDDEQGDGLGVLAAIDHGDEFEYKTYKSTEPHWQTLYGFMNRVWEESYRMVIHGRAATAGDVNRDNAHPISIDCDKCDVDYVVHNGSIRGHSNTRPKLANDGHHINTPVDSEIIGHKVGEIPDTVEDHKSTTYRFSGNLNYLVFNEDGIMVRVSKKYHLSDDFTMTCRPDELEDFEEGNDTEWMLISPGGEIETKERKRRSTRTSSGTGNRGKQQYGWGAGRYRNGSSSGASSSAEETYTVEYEDLVPGIDGIVAIRVSPRDIKLIDTNDDNVCYINRDSDPKEFYYYANEEKPDNLEQLSRIANSEQTELDEIAEEAQERKEGAAEDDEGNVVPLDDVTGPEREEAAEAAERAVVAEVANERGITLEEAADVADGVANLFGEA